MGKETKNKNKKQVVWPVWAKRALCIALLVAVLAGIIVAAIISSGTVLRNRIIVESKSGKFDVNQQMATFILWQAMYQQGYNEWINEYYTYLYSGSSSSSSSIDFKTHTSPDTYALTVASYYTKEALNSGLYSIKDYLIELVAGADAAIAQGMKYESHDKEDAKGVVTWMKNIYVDLGYYASGIAFKNFLSEYVGDSFTSSDIEDAAKVMIMYSKYSDYKSFELQGTPSSDNLQDYILKNPTGYFSTEYFSFTGASEDMIRDFFTEEFMNDRFESTLAKHYANIDRLAIADLKDDALNAKLEEHGLNNAQKYTKTTTDGEATYSPELDKAIGEYIFSTSNKAGTFAAISGDKCAYLIYFKENSTATEATVAFKKYDYDKARVKLESAMAGTEAASIDTIKALLVSCIKEGENTTDFMTDNDKASKLYEELKKDIANVGDEIKYADITKGAENTNVPKTIVNAIYPEKEDSTPYNGWIFVINDPNESYVVKVTNVDTENAKCRVDYVTYTDDTFAKVLTTYEAEFSLYLLESKVTAPTYNNEEMTTETFQKAVVQWLMDENFKELVLTRKANEEYDALKVAMADSNKDTFKQKLTELFGENAEVEYLDFYSTKKSLDPAVYDYIFNTKNKDKASVVVGKDDRVFLVYVAPTEKNEHEGHNHPTDITVVKAYIKEYTDFDAENEATKALMTSISEALLKEGRKAPEDFAKSAEDIAKAALEGFKKTEGATPWENVTTVSVTKKDTGKDYQAIISKIYPSGSSTTSVTLKTGEFYQADNNGTSYIFKITEINTTSLDCKVEYVTFEDEENYSYFRSIQSLLNSSISEKAQELEYPSSITSGSYQAWLFESEYKAAEGENKASRTFDRQANDLTFIATTNTKNEVTGLTIYMVEKAAAQDNDTEKAVYGAYQQFETEKEAQKALNKINGKTGFDLLDLFTSFKHTKEVKEYVSGGHYPGYVEITSPTIGVDLTESSISDANLKKWFFEDARNNYDVAIIKSADEKSYYLAVFASSEEAWTRSARSGWVDEAFTEHMKTLVADYEINESAMEKIDGVITSTTAATK